MKRYFYILPLALAAVFPVKMSAQSESERPEITPLLKSQWGQDEPFYYSTPIINGQHCRTGCGATALSQVIYYHKYPQQPASGTYSYETSRLGKISFDFGAASFNYDLMKDIYQKSDSEEDEAVKEVAELMFAAGVVLNMDYDLTESSASFGSVPSGLSKWFNYPEKGMRQLSRDYFTNEEWEQLIYDELKNNRPVLYLGGNGSSSHIFVCDGYKDGKFHMNWGWYGEKDGYFSLVNLQTERVKYEGILSLNSGQKIIVGVRGIDKPLPDPIAFATSFEYDIDGDVFTITDMATSYSNVSLIPGIKATDSEGNDYFFWNNDPIVAKGTSDISYSVAISSIPDGKYTVRPVYKIGDDAGLDDGIFPVFCNPRQTRFFQVEISDNNIVSAEAGTDANINVSISEFSTPSPLIKGETFNASFSVFAENNGNTNVGAFKLKFYEPDSDIPVTANELRTIVDLAPGDAKNIIMAIPNNLPAGVYDMYVVDGSGGTLPSYPVLSDAIRIQWKDNSAAFKWEDYNLRAMAIPEHPDEAILLKYNPGSTSTAQGLEGDFIVPETIGMNSPTRMVSPASGELKVTELGPRLVFNETNLKRVVLPSSIRNIGSQAFDGCTGISSIEIDATTPPTLQTKVFDESIYSTVTLLVPTGTVKTYQAADGWKNFATITDGSAESSDVGELTIDSFSISPGESYMTPVTLKTDSKYYGCQFDVVVPEGLSIASDGVSVSQALNVSEYSFNYSSKSNNEYIIILYSNNHTPFPTGTTDLVNITFQASQEFEGGTLKFQNIEFSMDSGDVDKSVEFDPTTCEVTLDGVSTSISEIIDFESCKVDVYNVSGLILIKDVLFNEIKASLTPGLYILRNGTLSKKVMVY